MQRGDGVDGLHVDGAGGLGWRFGRRWRGENLCCDVRGLRSVVGADVAGHEEAVDEAEDVRDSGPEEEQVEDAGGVATKVELVDAEASEEEREEEAYDLVFAGECVFGVEPVSLSRGHLGGVDGVGWKHRWFTPVVDECTQKGVMLFQA